MPGSIPRGCILAEDFGERRFISELGIRALGFAEYDHPLTEKEIFDYELRYSPESV